MKLFSWMLKNVTDASAVKKHFIPICIVVHFVAVSHIEWLLIEIISPIEMT